MRAREASVHPAGARRVCLVQCAEVQLHEQGHTVLRLKQNTDQKAQSPEIATIILNSSMVLQVENSTSVLHVIVPCQTTGAQH